MKTSIINHNIVPIARATVKNVLNATKLVKKVVDTVGEIAGDQLVSSCVINLGSKVLQNCHSIEMTNNILTFANMLRL